MRDNKKWNLPNCIDCNKRLGDYRSIRCLRCCNLKELNPNYGRKRSFEERKKTSEANKGNKFNLGRKQTKTHKENISKAHKKLVLEGKHPRWKGGIYPSNLLERLKFRQKIQKKVFERDNYTCQLCEIKGKSMTVDHIQSWAEYPDLRFNIDNCRTLCQQCHYRITYGKPMPPTVRTWGHNLERSLQT